MDFSQRLTPTTKRPDRVTVLEGKYIRLRPINVQEDAKELYERSHSPGNEGKILIVLTVKEYGSTIFYCKLKIVGICGEGHIKILRNSKNIWKLSRPRIRQLDIF